MNVQQLADYFCRQSMLGRGQWRVELCRRGHEPLPENTALEISLPETDEMTTRLDRCAVMLVARLKEVSPELSQEQP